MNKNSPENLPVSICITAHNEAGRIVDCLKSVSEKAAQIIVVNAGSTDDTVAVIKKEFPEVMVLDYPNELNFNINKMHSFEKATQDWLFYLDGDERFTEDLWQEIAQVIKNTPYNGFKVGRKNYCFGKWMRYGGLYPDSQPRLFRKGKGYFKLEHVHELLTVEGEMGILKQPFIHITYTQMSQYLHKVDLTTEFQARKWAEEGLTWSARNHFKYGIIRPLFRFIQRYILMFGFLDGFHGFFMAWMWGVSEFISYCRVMDYQKGHE